MDGQLQPPATPLSLAHREEGLPSGQALNLAYSNYHVKQFLEALLRNSAVQSKGDVDQHFSRSLEGRPDGAGVAAMSSMMDVQTDWYGEDSGELHEPPSSLPLISHTLMCLLVSHHRLPSLSLSLPSSSPPSASLSSPSPPLSPHYRCHHCQ